MRVVGIIQARMGSTRLPGKILAPIAGHPLLAILFERVRAAGVDEWWLATTQQVEDDVTAAWGEELGLRVYRGDTEDVLSRFTAIVRSSSPDWVVRLTADDPFVDAHVVDRLIAQIASVTEAVAVVGENPAARLFPLGYVPQVARASAMLAAADMIPDHGWHHRSHVLSWFYEMGGVQWFQPPEGWPARPDWRWTVDTALDLAMARAAFAGFGEWRTADYCEIVRSLDARSDVHMLNAEVEQKPLRQG